jgi:Cro/C1-type HTH DNA-binding domain
MEDHINNFIGKLLADKVTNKSELAQLLNISTDTFYKRLTQGGYSVAEMMKLVQHFGISPNELLQVHQKSKVFNIKKFSIQSSPVETANTYVEELYHDLSEVAKIGIKQVYYAAKDLPIFSFFSSPILASFKLFFWHNTLFESHTKQAKYNPDWLPKNILDRCHQLYEMYNNCSSSEIWNYETLNSTLHQIKYCKEIGLLTNDDAKNLQLALNEFIDALEQNCTDSAKKSSTSFTLYLNEILLLDNTVIFDLGVTKVFYIPYQTLNFLSSIDPEFTTNGLEWFNKQIKKSVLISGPSEKEREKLMNHYRLVIEQCK